ncbi:MAG: Clp1/GlmU family protein [Archaeoglobales archaeon]|nr:Clp1/GlmU family protein [Archaeoglobales archaeon]
MIAPKGCTVLAKGKVAIEGNAEVIGSNKIKSFESEKFVPIYCLEECKIELNGDYKLLNESTIPESWEKLAKKDWETVFLYGGVDSGKSTLATYLANKVGGAYVLDLDIGQADVAHAGAMGYGFALDVVNLSQVQMINGFFVGSITPQGRELKCLRGVARLWSELKKLEGRKIVDTTGWVKGRRAREYKLAKLEIIEPDLVVSFEGKPFEDWEFFEVENGFVMKRDKAERAKARCESYKKFLKNAKVLEIKKEDFKLKPDILRGKDVSKFIETVIGAKVSFANLGEGFLVICTEESCVPEPTILKELKELYEVDDLFIFSEEELKNLILGLYKGKKYLGMGLLKAINDKLLVESAFSDFDLVELGEIRFEEEKECFIKRF